MRVPLCTLAAAALLTSSCTSCGPRIDDPADAGFGPVTFPEVRRVVTLADNIASNPTTSRGFLAQLIENDSAVFPSFAGKDLRTRLPGVKIVRLDRGGDGFRSLASVEEPFCTCAAAACPTDRTCLDRMDTTPTLLVVELGINDLFSVALRLLNDATLRDNPTPMIESLRENVRTVLGFAANPAMFARPPLVVMANVHDPTDGAGDLAAIAATFFPIPDPSIVPPELANRVMTEFQTMLREEAGRSGAILVDVHAHFLGHAFHYDDASNPHHDASDATRWLRSVVDPNLRGAHEIRRVFWNTLTGEDVTEIPMDLPADITMGLPEVPANGWANAVVSSDITMEVQDPDLTDPYTNVVADPQKAVGPPSMAGNVDAVALGIVGAFIVLDMGEGEEVLDGEGDDLVVLEQGPLSGGVPEPYRVFLSSSPDGPWSVVGDGAGERAFDLAGSGVAHGRYVRIESEAQLVDVIGGVGSPFYPGPEIDAVGAVHPGAP